MFEPSDVPRAFALAPGVDFCRALVDGLDARLPGPPEALARVEIWVNTRRAGRALVAAYARGPARLLPRIRTLADLAADPLAPVDLAPAASSVGRKLDLARLVGRLIDADPALAPRSAAFDLADSLGDLLDEMQGEGVAFEALGALDIGEHAEHWRRSLRFLTLLAGYAAASAPIEGQARVRATAEAFAALWATHPPSHPVLVAGSTGSRGATRAFMAAVARLPQGAVVLPGFDAGTPAFVWDRLGEDDSGASDHPQHGFRRLADALGIAPGDIAPWIDRPPPAPARNRLVSLALRPAPVTDQWRTEGDALAPSLGGALANVDWIVAETPRAEARVLAHALRRAAETGERAALVTPDRALARRVTAELARWSIHPDDSAGRPLALTPPGVLLSRLAAVSADPLTPETLLALLKHPLTASAPGARKPHGARTARLELKRLRGGPPTIDWATFEGWAEPEDAGWTAWIRAALAPLQTRCATLAERVAAHRAAAEALAGGPDLGPHALWDKEAGAQARATMDALAADADAFGPIEPQDYRALLASLMAARDVPEDAVVTHPGIAIWGTLEARVQSADVVLLGSLNETVWPRLPEADSWLSRPMRRDLGLPSPERVIGLAAHDFQQAMGAPRVILSRAARDAEAPTVPSRWLLRLENLLSGLGSEGRAALADARARGDALLAEAALLERPEAIVPPARRPSPKPPAEARPKRLSVTQIERLVSDPYAIYARHVLRLKPLDPLGRAPDAMARGSAIHAALDAFLGATADALPSDARAVFLRETAQALAAAAPWPATRALWTARLARSADWFVASEAARRARAAPLAREVAGTRALEASSRPFAVTAEADRIDRGPDGYAIYDYKSGGVPSAKEALEFHLQLPLEAAIAAGGGFSGLPADRTSHMELVGLGRRKLLAQLPDPDETWARLHVLIGVYQDAETGFTARLRPRKIAFDSDYDHLSRRGEWADGGETES